MANKYRGFNTIDTVKKFRQTDFELVKRDLLNHFSIKKGEKLMQPNFGSIIWSLLFEPLTPEIQSIMAEDIRRIVEYDPRLQIDEVIVNEFNQGIQIQVEVTYLPENFSDKLTLNFNSETNNLTLT